MDFLKKIEDVQQSYENLKTARAERIETIQKTENEVASIESEMKKVEGSFITLVGLAKEAGQLDEAGNPIKKEAEVDGTPTNHAKKEK